MQFTTSQLTGGPRYSAPTLLGNYVEDEVNRKLAMEHYSARRESGDLLYLKRQRERNLLTQAVRGARCQYKATFSVQGLFHCTIEARATRILAMADCRCPFAARIA